MATMKDKKEKGYALGRSQEAVLGRNKQLKEWESSDTNREQDTIKTNRLKPRVKFSDGVIFLAATAAGDTNEVEHLIVEDGIDVNYKNLDGMTALHQCCIDDNLEMAMILVKNNADINAQDKEGWTPLHAASSCGHSHIVQYLLNSGAYPVPVNSDGDTPRDIAEDDEVLELLQGAIESQGIDVDNQKQREEHVLLNDAIKAKNNPNYTPIVSAGGATLLHIAAAKGYDQVIRVLLSTDGVDTDAADDDGWTPLHAAVYWGNMDAAELLVEKGANVNASTNNGENVDDIVDPELADRLEELKTLSASFLKDQKIFSHHIRTPSYTENLSFDSPKHNSPGLKRRLSKDRGDYPKMLDMLREKKELQQSMREMHVHEEQTTSPPLEASVAKEQSPALTTTTATQPQKEQQVEFHHPPQHHEQSSSEEETKQHQQLQVAQSLPVETLRNEDKRLDRDKRSSSVSERRKIFESSSIGSLDKKMAIQKREKTPGHSHSTDKDKNYNNSIQSTPLSHKSSDSNGPKRFNFVSKPVMSVDDSRITTESELKSTVPKRTSSAGRAKNVGNMQHRPLSFCSTSEYQDFQLTKTSPILHHDRPSLMAAAASASSKKQQQQQQESASVDSHDSSLPSATVNHNDRLHQEVPVVTTTASATASSSGCGNDSFSASFTSSTGSEPIDTSMLSTDRSMSFSRMYSSGGEEAEAKRRLTAKKKREARRVTQPVDDELWKQISREDAEEEKREDKLQAEAEKLAEELKMSEKSSDDSSVIETVTAPVATDEVVGPTHKAVQSRFKPAARPAPRIKADTLPVRQTLWSRPDGNGKVEADSQSVTSTAEPAATTSSNASNVSLNLSASLPANSGTSMFSSPKSVLRQDSIVSTASEATTPGTPGEFSRARLQSDVRRRPKNTRRSTGITFEDDSEKTIEEKPEVNDESNKSSGGGGRKLPLTPDQQHNDTSRVVPPPPPPQTDSDSKVAELQRLLDDVSSKKDKIYDDYYHAAMKIDELKKHNTELTRRSEDTSRAYEQEKKEKEKLQIRLKELEDMLKVRGLFLIPAILVAVIAILWIIYTSNF